MGENTKIEWAHHTFNAWEGCTKVSDGCKFCYAEARSERFHSVQWGPLGKRRRTSESNWKQPMRWNRKASDLGIRYRVFCSSLADVFEDKPNQPEMDEWRRDLFHMIGQTRNLDWLLLTKRPENVERKIVKATGRYADAWLTDCKNVWIGTSVENQEQADKRIPELLKIPASVRFLSMEPLLGPVDLSMWLHDTPEDDDGAPYPGVIDWVIVGGESGTHARPMHPDWVRSIRDQCQAAGVPFLFKQWGEWQESSHFAYVDGASKTVMSCLRDGQYMAKVGKHAAGRMLDGLEWNEVPGLPSILER